MSTSVLKRILLVTCLTCGAAVNVSVRLEENVTLTCDLNSSSVISWYRLNADKINLLIFAERGKFKQSAFIIEYNQEQSHFGLAADRRLESVRLVILGFRESDLGLYYCATGASAKNMHFGTAVRLTLADARRSSPVGCRTLSAAACVAGGICGFLCASALCHRKVSSAISCVKENSNVQEAQVQYSSLRFIRRSRATTPAPGNVTYSTVAKHTT